MVRWNLARYCRWMLAQPISALVPPSNALRMWTLAGSFGDGMAGRAGAVVIHREGQFQTEFVTVMGPGAFPPHRHPRVDSIEVLLAGDIQFEVDGRVVLHRVPVDAGNPLVGAKVRVRRNAAHGAKVGSAGAVFLSVQRWDDGLQPSSVALHWDGPEHLES